MSPKNIQIERHMTSTIFVLTILVGVVGCICHASAQWRAVDAQKAWDGYVSQYVHLQGDGYSKIFTTKQGGTTHEGFWTYAEELEVAEDAYNENPTTTNKNLIQALCDGFVNYVHPATNDDWSSNTWNDDLDVAIIAFARAYQVTGTTRWLNAAELNFATVWNRAQAGDGGLCERTASGVGCYENSSCNWTFVIAGNLLYNITGIASYKTEKDGVYAWAKAHLYNSTTGEIYDGPAPSHGQYTYNYGYAMIAGAYQGSNVMVSNIANYVFNNLTNYDGVTPDGYNLMPDYGQGDLNNSGFNGILMRGVAFANTKGYIPSAVMLAAQSNLKEAWSYREGGHQLVWDDWDANTPSSGNYSWDDSAALAGFLDIPPTT